MATGLSLGRLSTYSGERTQFTTYRRDSQVEPQDIPEPDGSNLHPMEYNIVVQPVIPRSKSSIILPDSVKDKEAARSMRGRIVAMSPLAFTYANDEAWGQAAKPAVGDAVLFSRHSGVVLTPDKPDDSLRVIKDVEIIAVIR